MTTSSNESKASKIPKASKYSLEDLKAEVERPRKKLGRPRKYNTEEERKAAQVEATKRCRIRARERAGTPQEQQQEPAIDISLRHKSHATEEERAAARAESSIKFNNSHREQLNFTAIARYHLGKLKS